MPELPELEAHAERLDSRYAGASLKQFTPLTFTALKTAVPPASNAEGHDLVFVGRRGKYLLFDFGVLTFVVHLMQGGRVKEELPGKQPAKPKTGVARWSFADDRSLLLTEAGTERRAGVWAVDGDPENQVPLQGLGPDANALDPASWSFSHGQHTNKKRRLCPQHGLGRAATPRSSTLSKTGT